MQHVKELEKEISALKGKAISALSDELLGKAEDVEGVKVPVTEVPSVSSEELREMGDKLRDKLGNAAIVLGTQTGDKVLFLSMVTKSLTKDGLHAGKIVQTAAQVCGGGGGGRPDMAQAGGRLPEKLTDALQAAKEVLIAQIKGI